MYVDAWEQSRLLICCKVGSKHACKCFANLFDCDITAECRTCNRSRFWFEKNFKDVIKLVILSAAFFLITEARVLLIKVIVSYVSHNFMVRIFFGNY